MKTELINKLCEVTPKFEYEDITGSIMYGSMHTQIEFLLSQACDALGINIIIAGKENVVWLLPDSKGSGSAKSPNEARISALKEYFK